MWLWCLLLVVGLVGVPAGRASAREGTATPPAPSRPLAALLADDEPPPSPPDVLNIVLDDMRDQSPEQVAAYMPKTVQWFAPGTFFANTDVSTPSCCPSRTTGMTGQYDHNNGMEHQQDVAKVDLSTFVEHALHQNGYQTALAGKFLHAFPDSRTPPDFDHYAMWISSAYNDPSMNVMGKVGKVKGYATTLTGNFAMQYIQAMAADPLGRPWYAYVAFHAPHPDGTGRFVPEPKYATAPVPACGLAQPGEADLTDKPPYAGWLHVTSATVQSTCQNQMRVLMSVDDQIDRLMTYLQTSGQLAHTMVLLWSDNGTMWGEHNRTSKFVPWLPSVNVPMWLRWDGHVPAAVSQDLVSNVDIAPTIYAATGVPPAAAVLDGHSLLEPVARPYELNEYWYDPGANGKVPTWAEIHTTHWAYIETYNNTTGALAFQEYYDLDADPGELTNLLHDKTTADDPPTSLVTTLSAELAAARTCKGAACP